MVYVLKIKQFVDFIFEKYRCLIQIIKEINIEFIYIFRKLCLRIKWIYKIMFY